MRRARGRAERRAGRARRRRLRAARLLRLRHRHARRSTGSRRTACATRTSTRPRSARRRGRACSPAATTTPSAWAASPTSPRAFPATTRASRSRAGFLPEMLVPHGYAAYAVGKWHLTPDDECHLARAAKPLAARARVRALLRLLRRRDAPVRAGARARQPPRRASRGRGDDGYHLTEDLVDHAIEFVARPARRPIPTSRSSSTSAPAPATRPTTRRRTGSSATAAASTTGWDVWRERDVRPPAGAGLLPAGTELSPRPEWVPAWDSLPHDEQRRRARYHGVLRRVPLATPTTTSAACSTSSPRRATSTNTLVFVLSDNGASSEGGRTARSTTPARGTSSAAPVEEAVARIDEIGGPTRAQQLPVGLDGRGQHAVPALEARGARGRRRRPARSSSWPRGIAARGEMRRQYVHAIDLAADRSSRSLGVEAPGDDRRRRADDRSTARAFAQHVRDADAPERRDDAVLRDARLPRDLPRRLEGGRVPPDLRPVGADFDDDRVGAVRRRGRPVGVPRPRRRAARPAARDDRAVVGGGRAQPGAAARQRAVRPRSSATSGPPRRAARAVRVLPVRRAGDGGGRGERAQPLARDHRRGRRSPTAGAEGILLAQGSVLGGYALVRARRAAALRAQLRRLRGAPHRRRPSSCRPGEHTLGVSLHKTGEHRGHAAPCCRRRAWSATGEIPRFTPTRFSITGDGLCCGYDRGMPVVDDYRPPFRVHRHAAPRGRRRRRRALRRPRSRSRPALRSQ